MKIISKYLGEYYIEADKYEYTVFKKTNRVSEKTGQPLDTLIGHYSKLSSAINRIVKLLMVDNHKTITLEEYINEYKQTVNRLIKLYKI